MFKSILFLFFLVCSVVSMGQELGLPGDSCQTDADCGELTVCWQASEGEGQLCTPDELLDDPDLTDEKEVVAVIQ